jgi:hypothetical protein
LNIQHIIYKNEYEFFQYEHIKKKTNCHNYWSNRIRLPLPIIQLTILPNNPLISDYFQPILQPLLDNPNPLNPHPLQISPIPHPLPNPPQLPLTSHPLPRTRPDPLKSSHFAGTFEIPFCGQVGLCGGVWGGGRGRGGVSAVEGGWVCDEYGGSARGDLLLLVGGYLGVGWLVIVKYS